MSFVDVIAAKNKIAMKKWPVLPKAFENKDIKAVIKSLKEEGWDVFDAVVDGVPVHMARSTINEIYFDNTKAIFVSSDYGRGQGKIFNISINGDYKANIQPEHYWCAI